MDITESTVSHSYHKRSGVDMGGNVPGHGNSKFLDSKNRHGTHNLHDFGRIHSLSGKYLREIHTVHPDIRVTVRVYKLLSGSLSAGEGYRQPFSSCSTVWNSAGRDITVLPGLPVLEYRR